MNSTVVANSVNGLPTRSVARDTAPSSTRKSFAIRALRNALSFCSIAVSLTLPLGAHATEAAGISDEEMRRALIAFERCVQGDNTRVTRPFMPVCGVPVYSRDALEQNLPYIRRNNYEPMSTDTDSAPPNRTYYYFKRDRDSQVVVALERKAGRVVIVGLGVSAH